MSGWETVHSILDYWDGPISGVADKGGAPHAFRRRWIVEADDWGSEYLVRPIDAETLALVVEDWAIWERWRAAFDRGQVGLDTHPALPPERARKSDLQRALAGRLDVPDDAPRFKAEFRGDLYKGPAEVRWLELTGLGD